MTTIYTSKLSKEDPTFPGTHVLIVGSGAYPALLGGDRKLLLENSLGLKQISSPPVSAKALADWFVNGAQKGKRSDGFHNPKVPLASIEMLVSPSQRYKCLDGSELLIDDATRSNIARCFSLWKKRSAANPLNIAVFYFCGHGVRGHNDYLLPSDFGVVNRENPWADAIDITETASAMRRLVGGPLYFFIDACRQASGDTLSPGAKPPALAYVDFKKPVKGFAQATIWATGEGQQAFGAEGEVSRFTKALLEGLNGYQAVKASNPKYWTVTGSLLGHSVSIILEQENVSLDPEQHQHSKQELVSSLPFQFLSRQPQSVVVGLITSWKVGPEVRQKLEKNVPAIESMPDQFREEIAEKMEAKPPRELTKEAPTQDVYKPTEDGMISVEDYFEVILPVMLEWKGEEATSIGKRVRFSIFDKPDFTRKDIPIKTWTMSLKAPVAEVIATDQVPVDLSIRITSDAMQSILRGDFDARKAITDGAIQLDGDLKALRIVGNLFSPRK